MSEARTPASTPPRGTVLAGLGLGTLTGLIAGAAAGASDALWSWQDAAQFVPGVVARLRFVSYATLSYAAAGALAGLALAIVVVGFSRATRLGDLVRHARAQHARRQGVAALAYVLAAPPCTGYALLRAYRCCVPYLDQRKNLGLSIAVAMIAAIGALIVGLLVAFVVARVLELLLGRVIRVPLLRRLLTSVAAPVVVAALMILGGGGAALGADWETNKNLPLRGPAVGVVAALLAVGAYVWGTRLLAWSRHARPDLRRSVWAAVAAAVPLAALALGNDAQVIKASVSYTGLGAPLAHGVRRAFDRDHDGFSRVLGGGDCDDGDASVYPGAAEVPDDGIDQNCLGGDAHAAPAPHDLAFVPVPATIPPDFNILVLTIDTLRADHLGAYGYQRPTSPRIDAVGADGTVFEESWAHAPSTRYSLPAILTGRLPLDVDYDTSVEGWPGLALANTTIAEVVKPQGFTTAAITNYWYFDPGRRMNQGFDSYDNTDARLHSAVGSEGPAHSRGSSSPQQTDKAIAFIDGHVTERWYLWVHYYDPHFEYERHPGSPSFGDAQVDLYDGEIRFTDTYIGKVVDDLKARGLYDKTAIVITGDHGEGFGEHGVFQHGYHLYAAQTKVPLIIRVPGLAPRRSTTPAGHIDLLPTLANLVGVRADDPRVAGAMGSSLLDVIAGAEHPDRTVLQQLSYEGHHEMRGAASRGCHVVYNVSPETSWEVYDTAHDPGERVDESSSDACASTRSALVAWFDHSEIPAGAVEALRPALPPIARRIDVHYGAAIQLLAVDAPQAARAGDVITLTWTFQATGTVDSARDWRMFVHLEDGKGARFTGDHAPVRPLAWWKAGDVVRYTTQVTVPRTTHPGAFTVWAGLFHGTTRMPASSTAVKVVENRAAVATFEITP